MKTVITSALAFWLVGLPAIADSVPTHSDTPCGDGLCSVGYLPKAGHYELPTFSSATDVTMSGSILDGYNSGYLDYTVNGVVLLERGADVVLKEGTSDEFYKGFAGIKTADGEVTSLGLE